MWMPTHTNKIMETNANTPEARKPASAGCHPTNCSLSDVPFHDLPTRDVILHDGLGCACPNGSTIVVWRIKDDDGFHIELRRKLEDGRMSLLKFGMSLEAATALVGVLQMQIYPEENDWDHPTAP